MICSWQTNCTLSPPPSICTPLSLARAHTDTHARTHTESYTHTHTHTHTCMHGGRHPHTHRHGHHRWFVRLAPLVIDVTYYYGRLDHYYYFCLLLPHLLFCQVLNHVYEVIANQSQWRRWIKTRCALADWHHVIRLAKLEDIVMKWGDTTDSLVCLIRSPSITTASSAAKSER